MPEWWEDLPIGAENLPFDELAAGNWGGAATAPVSAAFNLMDLPLSTVKEVLGQTHNVVQGEGLQGWGAGREQWDTGIKGLNEADLGPLGFAKSPIMVALELGLDPTTYFGVGLAKKLAGAARGIAAAPEVGGLASTALRGAATGIDVANFALNTAPEAVMGPPLRGTFGLAKKGIQKISPTAFEDTPQTAMRKYLQNIGAARRSQDTARKETNVPSEMIPWHEPGKSLAPIDTYEIPPWFDSSFDSGVSAAVKAKAHEAYARLSAKHQSFPDMPGVNAPGYSVPFGPESQGFPRPGGGASFLDKMRGRTAGVANIPQRANTTRFETPFDLGQLDDQDMMDLAHIMAAVMMDFDNDVANKMFAPLRRMGPGMEAVRREANTQFGPGIAPAIPAAYDEFRKLMATHGVDFGKEGARFLTNWGWPEGTISTKRLESLQRKVDRGMSLEDAYKQIAGKGFKKEDPEITEITAAMGGGFLQTRIPSRMKVNPLKGKYKIPGIDPETERAFVNTEFSSQFERNKNAYNKYVEQLVGKMDPVELEVLRQMSIESVYDEMMNAAGEFSGAARGATALYEAQGGSTIPPDIRPGDRERFTKRSMYPGENVASVAAQREVMPTEGLRYRTEQATTRSLNAKRAEDLGITVGKRWTSDKIAQEIRKAGGTPWEENPKGGGLLTLQKLLDHYKVGRDIKVGEAPSEEWYGQAADTVIDIVGPGNDEDAMVFMELMAATSTGTAVERNARNTIRAFAEWKFGSDDFIRNQLGLTPDQVDAILNKGGRWTGIRGALEEDTMFMKTMSESQKRAAGRIMGDYVDRRTAADPTWLGSQDGPKANNYLGSFVIKMWQDAIDYHMPQGPLRDKVRKALDDAASIYTVDRHDLRQSNLGTAAERMTAAATREARLIMSKKIPHVRPEDVQAATWYFSKDQQGFKRFDRTDDMANVLRDIWNVETKRDHPELDARVRDRIRAEHPGVSEEEMKRISHDLMRQEIALAIVSDGLKENKTQISRILGESNPLAGLFEAGDTTLGIVNRAAKGVPPRVPMSRAIPNLTSQAEDILGQVASGQSPGTMLRYAQNGRSFAPDDVTHGFVVGLTSLDKPVSVTQRKTAAKQIERFLGRYQDAFDDPDVAEHLRFGILPTEGGASFGLTVVVPDETVASELGRAFGQRSIYDLGAGRSLDLGGSGTPKSLTNKDLRDTVRGLFGKTPGEFESLRSVRERGLTLDEMDSVNPISILQRKVIGPVMERYRVLSESGAAATQAAQAPPPYQGVVVPQPDRTEPFDFASIDDFYQDPANRLLATQEAKILAERDPAGERVVDKLDAWRTEAEQDIAQLDASGVAWDPQLPYEKRLEMVDHDPQLKKLVEKYHDELGLDIRYTDPHAVEMKRLEKAEEKSRGVSFDKQTKFDLLRSAWGEMALFSPKYHTGNLQGAWFSNMLAGTFMHQGPGEVLAAFKILRGGADEVTKREALNSLYVGQIVKKWGDDDLPAQVLRGGPRDMTSRSKRTGTATGQIVAGITHSERLGNLVSKPLEANADAALAVDVASRGALYGDVYDREMTNAMTVIEDDIATMARKQGLTDFEFSQSELINPVTNGISAMKLKNHLKSMGFAEGYAERAGRNFAEAKKIAKGTAIKEMERVQFSYDRTNLDDFVSKIVPFHYYYSRAVRFYGEEALRHPYLFLNYMRYNDGIEDAQNDPGLSGRQKGFLKLMQSPLGFTLLMNPDSFLAVNKVFQFDSTYEPDGETTAGGAVQWLKARGIGLYPWIDGMMNLAGMYGDTFEPDLLGIRHKALIGSAINFLASQAGMGPVDAPYAAAMGQARWNVSSFVSQFTPDWLTQPVLPKAGGSTTDATIDTVIESRVMANNPGITGQDLVDIMTDPDSPEYRQAYQQAAAAGVIQQLLNFTLPGNFRMREASRDVRAAQTQTIWEAAEKAGVSPTEFKPSEGDVDFAAKYKRLTGKEWKPGDYAAAQAAQDLTKATLQQKPFVMQENEYYSLGTDEQRKIHDAYTDILTGKNPKTATLDPHSRRTIAQSWAYEHGYSRQVGEVYGLRDAYERTHAEFAEYKSWRDQMYDLSAHLGGSLAEYRRRSAQENPNAAQYFNGMIRKVREDYPQDQWEAEIEKRTTSADAYQSIMGKTQQRFDPAPVPGFPPIDVTLPEMQQAGGGGPGPSMDWVYATQTAAANLVR